MQDDIASGEIVILEEDDLVDYGEGGRSLPPM